MHSIGIGSLYTKFPGVKVSNFGGYNYYNIFLSVFSELENYLKMMEIRKYLFVLIVLKIILINGKQNTLQTKSEKTPRHLR